MNCLKRTGAVILAFALLLPALVAQTTDTTAERSLGDIAREERAKKQAKAQSPAAQPLSLQPQPGPEASTVIREVKIDPVKEADIRRLLEVSDAKATAEQNLVNLEKNIAPLLVRTFPSGAYRQPLIDLFFAKLRSKIDMQALIELAVPIYDKYLSDEDIKALIQFYGTPLGRKAITVLPKMAEEVRDQARQWGEGIGRQSMQEVLREHPELAQALQEAARGAKPR